MIYTTKIELNSKDDFFIIIPDNLMIDLDWHISDGISIEVQENTIVLINTSMKERKNGTL